MRLAIISVLDKDNYTFYVIKKFRWFRSPLYFCEHYSDGGDIYKFYNLNKCIEFSFCINYAKGYFNDFNFYVYDYQLQNKIEVKQCKD